MFFLSFFLTSKNDWTFFLWRIQNGTRNEFFIVLFTGEKERNEEGKEGKEEGTNSFYLI
jgi:hypothetical protein